MKLFLKGDRCYTDKCGYERRAYAPGQHGQARRRKLSNYGSQLRERMVDNPMLRESRKALAENRLSFIERATMN